MFVCVMLLLLIALTVTGWVFVRKGTTVKKGFPAELPQADIGSVNKALSTD